MPRINHPRLGYRQLDISLKLPEILHEPILSGSPVLPCLTALIPLQQGSKSSLHLSPKHHCPSLRPSVACFTSCEQDKLVSSPKVFHVPLMTISHPAYDHSDLLTKEHKTRTIDVLLGGFNVQGRNMHWRELVKHRHSSVEQSSVTQKDYKELSASGCRLQSQEVDNNGCVPGIWTLRS